MDVIAQTFSALALRSEKALVAFVTAGDPSLEALPDILSMLQGAGVDMIEIGLPFSDPIADGPTIQASSQRALDRGVRISGVMEQISRSGAHVPIVLMGYYNSALRFGLRRFCESAKQHSVSGVILSDLPPDEAGEWTTVTQEVGLSPIFLVAPTSTDARLRAACQASRGFVYAVSRTGVTGFGGSGEDGARALVHRVREATSTPVCVGFGIGTPAQVREATEFADGAVVGSWLVDRLHRDWDNGRGAKTLEREVVALKAATRR